MMLKELPPIAEEVCGVIHLKRIASKELEAILFYKTEKLVLALLRV